MVGSISFRFGFVVDAKSKRCKTHVVLSGDGLCGGSGRDPSSAGMHAEDHISPREARGRAARDGEHVQTSSSQRGETGANVMG